MAKNGKTWKWAIGIIISLAVTALASMNALGIFQGETKKQVEHNHEAIKDIKPEVKLNTEHRHRFEEKVSNIERDVGLILEAVQK